MKRLLSLFITFLLVFNAFSLVFAADGVDDAALVTKRTSTQALDSTTVTVKELATPVTPSSGGVVIANGLPPLATVTLPEDFHALSGLIFDDIAGVPWAHEAIVKLQAKGIIQGKAPKKFDPNGYITRAEFAAMANRLFVYDATPTDEMTFSDVKATDWFYDDAKAACAKGFILGDSSFAPNLTIERRLLAIMICRIPPINTFQLKDFSVLDAFKDKIWFSASVVDYIQLVVEQKFMIGRSADTFAPNAYATRAEVAVILYRMKDQVKTILE